MSIATLPGAPRRLDVCPTAAAASRLDRALAPLADLGDAIRDEIAASLAPIAHELETALERMSTLELRAHDLEARLATAAAALLGLPIPATRPAGEKEPMPTAEQSEAVAVGHPVVADEINNSGPNRPKSAASAERQRSRDAAMPAASAYSGLDTPSTSSAATGAAVEVRMRKTKPRRSAMTKDAAAVAPIPAVSATTVTVADVGAETLSAAVLAPLTDTVAASGARAAAANVRAAPVLNTPVPSVSESSCPAQTAVEPVEPVSDPSGASRSAAIPDGDTHEGVRSGAPPAVVRDPATGILHPLLEQGAREMIVLGHDLLPSGPSVIGRALGVDSVSLPPTVAGGRRSGWGGGGGRPRGRGEPRPG